MNLMKRVSTAVMPIVALTAAVSIAILCAAGCAKKDDVSSQAAAAPANLGGPTVTPDVQAKIQAQEQADSASRAASAAAQAGKPQPAPVKK